MNIDEENKIAKVAQEYQAVGVSVCRDKPGSKEPAAGGWAERSHSPAEFAPNENLGLSCGWLSNGGVEGKFLMCVDLDVIEAIQQADRFLPATGAIEGRDSKPRSHWWFYVTDVPAWAISEAPKAAAAAIAAGKSPGPRKFSFRRIVADSETRKRGTVIDFIGTGGQTVVPPSFHGKSGEYLRWENDCSFAKIATVPFTELYDAVCGLARACGAKVPDVDRSVSADESEDGAEPAETITPITACADATVEPAGQVQGTCTRECDVPMDERVWRCEAYLRATELAKSGFGGHNTTYRVARLIVNDFAVTDRERAMRLLRLYNRRLKAGGEDEWSERELEHKLSDAFNAPDDPDRPFGCKLRERKESGPPRTWNDAARLAEDFLDEHTVRFVKQTAFEYHSGVYRIVSGERLAALVRMHIERAAVREYERRQRCHTDRCDVLKAAATASLPGGSSEAECKSHMAAVKKAQSELTRLQNDPPTVDKVSECMVTNTVAAIAGRNQLPDDTETDSWLEGWIETPVLVVANGLLEPLSHSLRPHTPYWFSTAKLPVAFDPSAPVPERWLGFLDDVMEGDAERVAVLQELFGACLDRTYPAKCFGALVGSGDNGKSVVLAVLRFLLGSANCSAVSLDELSKNRFAAFALFGRLANIVGDQGHFESHDEGRLKTLTGGDLVTFEQKGKDPFVAVNRAKLIFACNAMPSFGDKSEAIWNRLIAVPFDYTVPACKKNPALLTPAYWTEELPGILNWALGGLAQLRSQGRFTRSSKCEAMKGQTRLDSNPARMFLTEECGHTGKEEDRIPVDELYRAYTQWCEDSGFTRPLTKPKFGKEVRAVYPRVPESKVVRHQEHTRRCWVGLKRLEVTEVALPAVGA